MNFIKENKLSIILSLLIFILYFAFRLPNLTLQPIFADEAIYIRWAQVMKAEPTLRFISLTDGKTPLFMWAMIPFFKVFNDPLVAGRFLSVLSGFVTLLGVLFLGWKFFKPKVGLWAAFLIAITPFAVFFDRMALVDSMLAAFSIWSLNLGLLLVKYQRVDLAMFLGYALGGGLLTKTPGMFNILALPVTLVTFSWLDHKRQSKLVKLFALWILALGITFVIYNMLRLGPGFSNLTSRNQDYVFSPLELVGRPLDPFIPHLHDLADWFPKLFTPIILVFIFAGAALAFMKKNRYVIAILLWLLVPLTIECFLLRTFTARYILSSIPPMLFLAGWAISEITALIKLKTSVLVSALIILLSAWPLVTNYYLLTAPEKADLPRSERSGYLEGWTAGYGFPEIAKYLTNQSKNGLVIVGTEGFFGTLPDGLQIYLDKYGHSVDKEHQVLIVGSKAEISEELRKSALIQPTFFVANRAEFLGQENIQLIKAFPKVKKPDGTTNNILFYQVFPKDLK